MISVESGMVATFPITQTVAGFDYIPEAGTITVRDRAGNITHTGELDPSKPYIQLPEVITTATDYRWVKVTFTTGGQVLHSNWSYQIIPFLGTTVSIDQVRTLLTVDQETLPDAYIDITGCYLAQKARFPEVPASEKFDRLVLLTEGLRLIDTASVWLCQTRSVEDATTSRFKTDFTSLRESINTEIRDLVNELDPTKATSAQPPNLLQFVAITDAFTGA